jgi:hypothetical protein
VWCNFRGLRNRFAGKAAMRHCSAWLLCALLLILCANAKLARYEIHKQTLRLASIQTYLDGDSRWGRRGPVPSQRKHWALENIDV